MNSTFAHSPRTTFKFDDPSDEFAWFYLSDKSVFHVFLMLLRYAFLHIFLASFGINFNSILEAFWYIIPCCFATDFSTELSMASLSDLEPKRVQTHPLELIVLSFCFDPVP